MRCSCLLYAFLLLVVTGSAQAQDETAVYANIRSTDVKIPSRGVQIPGTLVVPATNVAGPVPYILMAHGHGASRDEGGGFREVAEALAARGIASVRVDFPGCGESDESFRHNNLGNMLADLRAARDYADLQPEIDGSRAGLLGFSMGGRLTTLLATEQHDFDAMVLWSPAVQNGASREANDFGGDAAYAEMRALAERDGFAPYTTSWGKEMELGPQWFSDLESTRPMDALGSFEGSLLVVYGTEDEVVLPATSRAAVVAAAKSRKVESVAINGGTHDLGFYSEHPAHREEVLESTVEFLLAELR